MILTDQETKESNLSDWSATDQDERKSSSSKN